MVFDVCRAKEPRYVRNSNEKLNAADKYTYHGYSDILHNPTHFHGPFVYRIRQVPLCIYLCLTVMLESLCFGNNRHEREYSCALN
jgi:hypothetical protein